MGRYQDPIMTIFERNGDRWVKQISDTIDNIIMKQLESGDGVKLICSDKEQDVYLVEEKIKLPRKAKKEA
jgi:hypothetical protein